MREQDENYIDLGVLLVDFCNVWYGGCVSGGSFR